MSLLISPEALERRRDSVRGPLAPLARSLRNDLQPLLDNGFAIPTDKALLSRDGGRCPLHGTPLEFDPYRPQVHRCPTCGKEFTGERHDRAWVMWYQLWLAERSVHAAALHALTGEPALRELAARIIAGYADRYLLYPNRDNVLGPTRPFFSTYLESIWLLQLCVALDLLEMTGSAGSLSGEARDRLIEPSAALVASFNEGGSNRQVWNDAALLAAGILLGDADGARRAISGRSGLLAHLSEGLLGDGTWYEGENYHLFAHRGLWYGVMMAERSGEQIPRALRHRFLEAFAAPLATALPDFTFPSRRDSQYGISLRQWRFAESCELGLALGADGALLGALHALYAPGAAPSRGTGRWRSTAEAERNEPAAALTRADLGWRSLLLARESLSGIAAEPLASPARSALLAGQGIAVLRRDSDSAYIALDYGHSGGGHGHPDRLNVILMHGDDRWLDDMGTGSYVDRSLHWYRSTLAHNAPLVNGRSQRSASGVLRAFEDRGEAGWVDAELPWDAMAPGVRVRRSLVAMADYAVDRLEWESRDDVRFELPLHITATLDGAGPFTPAALEGGASADDGFAFVRDASVAEVEPLHTVRLRRDARPIGWAVASSPARWWRAVAPGAPGAGERQFHLLRMQGRGGTVFVVWSWGSGVDSASFVDGALLVHRSDGSVHVHRPHGDGWCVAVLPPDSSGAQKLESGGTLPAGAREASRSEAREVVELGAGRATDVLPRQGTEVRDRREAAPISPSAARPPRRELAALALAPGRTLEFQLGREAYRVSEESWEEAGRPSAVILIGTADGELVIDVEVRKSPLHFRSTDAADPALDNEPPDIHSDGVQLYLQPGTWDSPVGWLAVPEAGGAVRTSPVGGARPDVPLKAHWRPTPEGYAMRFSVPLGALAGAAAAPVGLEVVVNDMAPGRARRRGQLVLSGGAGEYVYLRGDREASANFRHFILPSA